MRHIPPTLRMGSVGMAARGGGVTVYMTCSWVDANRFRVALGCGTHTTPTSASRVSNRRHLRPSNAAAAPSPRLPCCRLPPAQFHVTLGFMGKDVHDVPKDESTHLPNPRGEGAAWDNEELAQAIARRAEQLLSGGGGGGGSPAVGGAGRGGGEGEGTPSPNRRPGSAGRGDSPYGTPAAASPAAGAAAAADMAGGGAADKLASDMGARLQL